MSYNTQIEEIGETPSVQSQFNENAYQILRLHGKYLDLEKAKKNGRFRLCLDILQSIECELDFDANKLDKAKKTNYVEQIKKLNIKMEYVVNHPVYYPYIYKLINIKYKLMKEIQNESGKGATYKDADSDFDMD